MLSGKKKQDVPYLDSKVVLTRYGVGGTKLVVRLKDQSQIYEFDEFCLNICSAVEPFVPLVGTCLQKYRNSATAVKEEDADAYNDTESFLKSQLKQENLTNGKFFISIIRFLKA